MTGLKLRALGHATIALYRDGENPILATDPWLIGSVYWRSWWLQNYPTAGELDWLAGAEQIYVTHEHPDHFHLPSIRRLGRGPRYWLPALPEPGWIAYLTERGYRAEPVPARRWHPLAPGIAMMSIPLWNDDSLLLIDTPDALILNLNDAKPLPPVMRELRRLVDGTGKRRVLLASYSPASMVNSFIDDDGIVSLRPREHYVSAICRLCDKLGADIYMPFASQAVFERGDSQWANAYRTLYPDLARLWDSPTRLLPPYATLDLGDFTASAPDAADYRPADPVRVAARAAERLADEEAAAITEADIAAFRRKLNVWRWMLAALFPRGIGFRLGRRRLGYDPWRGRLGDSGPGLTGGCEIAIPALTIKEALANDHLTDLGITMFVRVRLDRRARMRRLYGIFLLWQFHDYGHVRGPRAIARWARAILGDLCPRRLSPLPAGAVRRPAPADDDADIRSPR